MLIIQPFIPTTVAPERHMTVNASDPEGQVLTYAWETVGSPAGTFYQLFPSNTPASNINPVAYRGSLGTVYNVKVTVSGRSEQHRIYQKHCSIQSSFCFVRQLQSELQREQLRNTINFERDRS